jgi:hypothetical protein
MSRGGDVERTILKVVLAYSRRSGWFVDTRPSVGWYTYPSHSLRGSQTWIKDDIVWSSLY